jgi:hypothetical protein
MRHFRMKTFAASAAAFALCMSPTVAAAATTSPHSVNPLVAVSLFGTQASAQQVCNPAVATAAAGAAAAAQAQPGCVLPAVDAPLPPPQVAPPPPVRTGGFGISPIILGLLGIAALAALIAGSNDDSDSPVSPG